MGVFLARNGHLCHTGFEFIVIQESYSLCSCDSMVWMNSLREMMSSAVLVPMVSMSPARHCIAKSSDHAPFVP